MSNEQNTFDNDPLGAGPIAPKKPRKKNIQNMDWLAANWVWIVGLEKFVRKEDHKSWTRRQFDSKFNHLSEKKTGLSAALFNRTTSTSIERYEDAVFRPGDAEVIGADFNMWRPSRIVPKKAESPEALRGLQLWNTHLEYLFQDEDGGGSIDLDRALDWMAWVMQNPAVKPNHALLIVGKNTGTGKSFVARVMEQLVGHHNTQRPKNSSLGGQFNGWVVQCKLCLIEELMQVGRRENLNALRDIITESPIEVNIKNVNPFLLDNFMAMLGISNHPDALPIDRTERRWLVVTVLPHVTRNETDYYTDFVEHVLENDEALAAIAWELQERDLGNYSGLTAAPETEGREKMVELSTSPFTKWLREVMPGETETENESESEPVRKLFIPSIELLDPPSDFADAFYIPSDIRGETERNERAALLEEFLRDERGGRMFTYADTKGDTRPTQHRVAGKTGPKLVMWGINGGFKKYCKLEASDRVAAWKAERVAAKHAIAAEAAAEHAGGNVASIFEALPKPAAPPVDDSEFA